MLFRSCHVTCREALEESPALTAVFYSDCSVLARAAVTLGHSFRYKLPIANAGTVKHEPPMFVDLVSAQLSHPYIHKRCGFANSHTSKCCSLSVVSSKRLRYCCLVMLLSAEVSIASRKVALDTIYARSSLSCAIVCQVPALFKLGHAAFSAQVCSQHLPVIKVLSIHFSVLICGYPSYKSCIDSRLCLAYMRDHVV